MNYETKRDVLLYFGDYVLRNFNTPNIIFGGEQVAEYMQRYDAALPDDLPVIPKEVGYVIAKLKHKKFSLSGAMSYAAVVSLSSWMTFEHEEDFARAWLLGAWRVEESGEIVKLEEEK